MLIKNPRIGLLYPPDLRDALIRFGARKSHAGMPGSRGDIKAIDALTDTLVARGYCRARRDESRASEWAALRAPGKALGADA